MKTLEETIQLQKELEPAVMPQPGVSGMDVSNRIVNGIRTDEFVIRIFVKDSSITHETLKLLRVYKGVNIEIIERSYTLH